MKLLPRAFYDRDPLLVAPDLLGKILVRKVGGYILSGRIIETEAYLAFDDEASHSFIGKTKRNASMYKDAGHAYVYRIHMHHCLNVVTEGRGIPSAVLIRALDPLEGIESMKIFRKKELIKDLTSGPGKLTQALQITKEFDGVDMTDPKGLLYIMEDEYIPKKILSAGRIGISKAKDALYRFYISPYIYALVKKQTPSARTNATT